MADKSVILKSFNEHFFEFIDDIITIIQDNAEIKMAKTAFQTIKSLNPSSIIKVWFSYIYMPYRNEIDNGDISYFLNKDYKDDLDILENSNDIISVIDKLRNPIKSMSDINKNHSTEYIQNLSKLSDIYNNL